MGLVAAVACTVIAIMFLYNWFNKETTSPSEKTEFSQPDTVPPKKGDVLQSQAPSSTEQPPTSQPSLVVNQNENIHAVDGISEAKDPTATKTPSVLMPPPPPPSSIATSIQPASPPRLKPPTIGRSPAAPRPGGGALRPPPSAASSLRVPVTKVLQNASMAPSSLMPPPPKKASQQVILEPGHSPLDWAALTSNPNHKLRGKDAPDGLIKVTPSLLKAQNGRKDKDAWTVYQGKVYNITPYIPFHPGGKGEILRGAGKDSAKLFMEVHPWVNWDGMLGECCVGILVGEDDIGKENIENKLDEMD